MIAILILAAAGCSASHEPLPDAGVCIELGAPGCLLHRPCWCWPQVGADTWRCTTCPESCPPGASCECRSIGGGPCLHDVGGCQIGGCHVSAPSAYTIPALHPGLARDQ